MTATERPVVVVVTRDAVSGYTVNSRGYDDPNWSTTGTATNTNFVTAVLASLTAPVRGEATTELALAIVVPASLTLACGGSTDVLVVTDGVATSALDCAALLAPGTYVKRLVVKTVPECITAVGVWASTAGSAFAPAGTATAGKVAAAVDVTDPASITAATAIAISFKTFTGACRGPEDGMSTARLDTMPSGVISAAMVALLATAGVHTLSDMLTLAGAVAVLNATTDAASLPRIVGLSVLTYESIINSISGDPSVVESIRTMARVLGYAIGMRAVRCNWNGAVLVSQNPLLTLFTVRSIMLAPVSGTSSLQAGCVTAWGVASPAPTLRLRGSVPPGSVWLDDVVLGGVREIVMPHA